MLLAEATMDRYVIRVVRTAHCKRGPDRCEECRRLDRAAICLLDLAPPDAGLVQRRVMPVEIGGETVWREYDVVRAFSDEAEARDYARAHGIADVVL